MRALAVIPARGGSRGIPRKNVALVGGRPLIAWTIDAARGARSITRAIVSTDDEAIAAVARACGADVPFLRPAALAADDTPGLDPILHAVDTLEAEGERFDVVLCLQPTSPLRTASDIDAALDLLTPDVDAVVAVAPARQHPLWIMKQRSDGLLTRWSDREPPARRQELPPAFVLNGALYAARIGPLREHRSFHLPRTIGYVMPEERSIDIDTPLDLQVADLVLSAAPESTRRGP